MEIVTTIKSQRRLGIFADYSAKDTPVSFRKANLIYGFNGSGKSTLSLVFASLEAGALHKKLPEDCEFEIAFGNDKARKSTESLAGYEARVCVFNEDFIEKNLRWSEGRVSSIFYLSERQADLVKDLSSTKDSLSQKSLAFDENTRRSRDREKAFKGFRTERARAMGAQLFLGNRRYEAPQLQEDYRQYEFDKAHIQTAGDLAGFIEVAKQEMPAPPIATIEFNTSTIPELISRSVSLAKTTLGMVALRECEDHPSMVSWMLSGQRYHSLQKLDTCLLCGGPLTEDRKQILARAFNSGVDEFLNSVRETEQSARNLHSALAIILSSAPKSSDIDPHLRIKFSNTRENLLEAGAFIDGLLEEAARLLAERNAQPTVSLFSQLATDAEVREKCDSFAQLMNALNAIILNHNTASAEFLNRQSNARLVIRRHLLAETYEKYAELANAASQAEAGVNEIVSDIERLRHRVADLEGRARSHGPAAERVSKLVRAYLGHGELSIFAVEDGYELRRHGKLVKGPPSEGERRAIALCYFLSTLEADGRKLKDLIVVIDDPVSSLDTKAMNYACAMVRAHLEQAAQLFVLTHNQHCMNEFKKAWQKAAEKKDGPTASLLYIDVMASSESGPRTSRIVEMPGHLRGHDSEYHFLCHKILQFEEARDGHFDYWFMMPNVLRKTLDIFLAFKDPGSHAVKDKLQNVGKKLPGIDPLRLAALDRLIQFESHSSSLEQLTAYSSMTVEETREANAAILVFMTSADPDHMNAIRKQCGRA